MHSGQEAWPCWGCWALGPGSCHGAEEGAGGVCVASSVPSGLEGRG